MENIIHLKNKAITFEEWVLEIEKKIKEMEAIPKF